jgi:nucleoside phosphorylase
MCGVGIRPRRAATRTVDEMISPVIAACVEMQIDTAIPSLRNYLATSEAKAILRSYGNQMRPVPEIKYGLIVSGSSVVAHAEQVKEIITRHPASLGLEMEIFAIYTAAQKSIGPKKPAVIGIKGVADFGDGLKHGKIQPHASILSFYVMLALVRKLYSEGQLEAV